MDGRADYFKVDFYNKIFKSLLNIFKYVKLLLVMNNLSLVEKYRPNKIKDIKDQEYILNAIKKTIINKDIPHLLFYGQPGVGKTTTAITLIKYLFSKNNYKDRILELNASDERGIQIVREKIKILLNFQLIMIKHPQILK